MIKKLIFLFLILQSTKSCYAPATFDESLETLPLNEQKKIEALDNLPHTPDFDLKKRLATLPNVSGIEEYFVRLYEIDEGEVKKQLDVIFLQKKLFNFFSNPNKMSCNEKKNNAKILKDCGFTILSMTSNSIVCTHPTLPNYVIKASRPSLGSPDVFKYKIEEDYHLLIRIIYRNIIQGEIEKKDFKNVKTPVKNTYIFPWARYVDQESYTKPYIIIEPLISEKSKNFTQEQFDHIIEICQETNYFDIKKENFIIDSDNVAWIIDTEVFDLETIEDYLNSVKYTEKKEYEIRKRLLKKQIR